MTAARYVTILEAVRGGASWEKAARLVGCSKQLVGYVLAKGAAVETMKPVPALPSATKHYRRWSAHDDARLASIWGELSLEETARALGRSPLTTYWRARKLDLGSGVPQGSEYLSAACRRTGFHVSTLRVILGWADVPIRETISRPDRPRGKRKKHFVDPLEVDGAVHAWMHTETLEGAERRTGRTAEYIRRLVLEAGFQAPARKHWRLDPALVDRVLRKEQS